MPDQSPQTYRTVAPRPEELTQAMHDAMLSRIRDALREKILQRIEPDINAAIDAAMESFQVAVGVWKDHASFDTIIKVVLDDRRKKE